MSKQVEQEWTLVADSGKKIVRAEIVDDGHCIKYYTIPELKSEKVQLQVKTMEFDEMFPIVDIENVSLDDNFMKYEPETDREKRVLQSIIKAKMIGMKNFRIPAMDPSLDDDGETIIYCAGRRPAVGKSAKWWYENAPKFMPNKNSRMRDNLEHDVVLGVMQIKYLVEEGYKVQEAWKAVCVDSTKIGHYRNSFESKYSLETTGSRPIGKCYDLGNTCKIVRELGTSGFELFGGNFILNGYEFPLADTNSFDYPNNVFTCSVGELVLNV